MFEVGIVGVVNKVGSEQVRVDVSVNVSDRVNHFLRNAQATNTTRGYASDWADFATWCATNRATPLPASAACVSNYLADLAVGGGAKKNTISRRLAAINKHHEQAGHARPGSDSLVGEVMRGIRRDLTGDLDQASPLTLEILHDAVLALEGSELRKLRDRAVLCVGFAAALRRSELVAMWVGHLKVVPSLGLELVIPSSKTDQEQKGHHIGLSHTTDRVIDPVVAVETWMREAQIVKGPVFRGLTSANTPRPLALSARGFRTSRPRSSNRLASSA